MRSIKIKSINRFFLNFCYGHTSDKVNANLLRVNLYLGPLLKFRSLNDSPKDLIHRIFYDLKPSVNGNTHKNSEEEIQKRI